MDGTPKLDRERYLQEMRAQVEAVLMKVADAVNNAAPRRVIADSEEPAREAFAQFREAAYRHAVQMRLDAAEAAFSPPPTATGRRPRHKGRQEYSVLTVNGRVRLKRIRWQAAGTPTDRWLDAAEATISQGVRELDCRLKGAGWRWDARNAEAAMALDALDQSGPWDAYWPTQARTVA